jgi:hypothetical protein
MAKREMVSVVWHRSDLQIDMSYVHGDQDHWIGSDVVAAVLADDAELRRVLTAGDTIWWVRELG